MKKDFAEREEGYKLQLAQLRKKLSEKENIEGVIAGRIERMRNEKEEETQRLQALMEKQKIASEEVYKDKCT